MYDILFLVGGDVLKIIKYKKLRSGLYKVELNDGRILSLYEDIILKYQLLFLKEINDEQLILMEKDNQEWDVYYVALKKLNSRSYSVFDLRQVLLRKEYPEELVEKAIQKLIDQGYLDDRLYTRSYIHDQIMRTLKGPYRLEKELLEKKIDPEIIKSEIECYSKNEQLEKIHKAIQKGMKSNHSRGGLVLKQKLFLDLKHLGHDISFINEALSDYSFTVDYSIAKKEYEKLYHKYSRKYEGEQLEKVIHDKMFQKGFSSSEY